MVVTVDHCTVTHSRSVVCYLIYVNIYISPSTDHQFNLWSLDGETDRRDSFLTNSMQNIGE